MILDTIVEHKHEEVARLRRDGLAEPASEPPPRRPFTGALLEHGPVAIIAEAKKASPSKGLLCPDFDPVRLAHQYKRGGAAAISVLTDERFFQGSLHYLDQVRRAVDLPVLRKDFLIDELQIRQAALWGADAILLIVAILEDAQLRDFSQLAAELGLDVLTEVHDETELERACRADCPLIGVNNRNLRDFTVDLETTFRLHRLIPDRPMVSESGIRGREDMARLAEAGITGALIGETLVKAPDPAAALADLRAATREAVP